jgi:hypothetical protein
MLKKTVWCCVVFCLAAGTAAADGGDIQKALKKLDNGYVRMTYAARDGVCGNGWNSISFNGSSFHISHGHDENWDRDCDEGPVRLVMKVRNGEVSRIKTRVGGQWSDNTDGDLDLGVVSGQDAADFLLDLAENSSHSVAEDAILPAVLAGNVVVWPRLLEIAREDDIDTDVRQSAVFWLGNLAGEKVVEGLVALVEDDDEDMDVRETAVFALSQREGRDNTQRLLTIAKTNPHPQIRKQALFWLAQRDDPEVLDIFEEILLGD